MLRRGSPVLVWLPVILPEQTVLKSVTHISSRPAHGGVGLQGDPEAISSAS